MLQFAVPDTASGLPDTYSPLLFTNTILNLFIAVKFSTSQAPLLLKWSHDIVLANEV